MSDNENGDLFDQRPSSQSELLDELGSLKELLDEEIDSSSAITSVNDIRSVKEYMLLKQQAEDAGLDLDSYLAKRAGGGHAGAPDTDDDAEIPMLDEVVELDAASLDGIEEVEYPAVEEDEAIPTLDEVYDIAEAVDSGGYSLEAIEQMVHELVEQKLQAIRPQLEKQIFDEIRNMLPVDRFYK